MQSSRRAGNANKVQKANPRWERTRRVAYDPEEEEDQPSVQSVQPTPNSKNQHDVEPLIKPIQDVARDCPTPDQSRPRNARQYQETSAIQTAAKSRQRERRTKAPEASASSPKIDVATNADDSTPNQALNDPNDNWIICERYDENSHWHRGYYGDFHKAPDGVWEFTPAAKQPKGSLGYRPRRSRKRKTKFTDLPPEIRNTIYGYAVPERRVLIVRRHPKKEARELEGFWSDEHITHKPRQSRLMYEPEQDHTSEDFGSALKLLLTCKQIKGEVETFLYSQIQFCFYSLKPLRSFLHTAPENGIQAIRSVYIRQDGYGNPRATENQRYREKYYQRWMETCAQLGQKATSLEHLKLSICDKEWPAILSGKEYTPVWGEAFLKSAPALLPKVEIRVHHKMVDRNQEVLKDLARRVEDSMMTHEGRQERDRIETEAALAEIAARKAEIAARKAAKEERERQRLAKLNAPPPPTELVISMDDIQKEINKTSVVNKVRSKGLDKFSKLDTSMYGFEVWRCD